jgi:hypothetical protein
MAKKRAAEPDEVKLKKKIGAKLTNQGNAEGDAALRSLRKRRALVQRKKRAAGSKGTAATPASA